MAVPAGRARTGLIYSMAGIERSSPEPVSGERQTRETETKPKTALSAIHRETRGSGDLNKKSPLAGHFILIFGKPLPGHSFPVFDSLDQKFCEANRKTGNEWWSLAGSNR
ncbi:hypothetical protein [Henriciella aquimarina]|uniref:hypothetical protein n=1 Tax=Henriciella aquimarina TaxID=545261 RepID=UPI001179C07C|nr:hypothetical protein [Henriciella aquimarina]